MPGLGADIAPEDSGDGNRACAFIADQSPWWAPGTATGYHALTFRYLLGEFVHCATGGTLADAPVEHIAVPLDVSDELATSTASRGRSQPWQEDQLAFERLTPNKPSWCWPPSGTGPAGAGAVGRQR